MASKEELKEKFSTGKKPSGEDFAKLIDGVEGPQGPQGADGSDGSDGIDGSDGFGTESQYNEINDRLDNIQSRLDVLEEDSEGD